MALRTLFRGGKQKYKAENSSHKLLILNPFTVDGEEKKKTKQNKQRQKQNYVWISFGT